MHLAIQFSQPYLLKRLYSPHCIFLPPLSPIGHIGISLFLDYFYNSFIYVPVFAQCHIVWLLQLCSILWNQETWCLQLYSSSCTRLLWLFGIFCGFIQILGFFIYVKKCHWNFDSNCIEYYIALSSMEILTTLVLPVHKHGIYFVSSSKS